MKKWLFACLLFWALLGAQAQSLTQAEKLYQDGDFATAQTQYEELLKTATGDTLYQAQLRKAACQYSQGEYLNAAKTLFDYPLPKAPLWKARFLLYRIHFAHQVANRYRSILQEHEIEGQNDLEHWTQPQWKQQIQHDYDTLWTLRNDLLQAPIEQENLFLTLKDTDTQRIPTLFDFVVQQEVQFLQSSSSVLPLEKAHTYSLPMVRPAKGQEAQADKLAQLLQTAYQAEGTGRQNARIFWQTDYILLPFEHENLFDIDNREKALQAAVHELNLLSGYTRPVSRWWQKLKKPFSSTTTAYGQSYVAYQTAQLLYRENNRTEALNICRYAVEKLPASYYTDRCQALLNDITAQAIHFMTPEGPIHPQHPQLKLNVRNVPTVHVRLYPLTRTELEQFYNKRNQRTPYNWTELLHLDDELITQLLTSGRKYQTATFPVTYEKPYFAQDVSLPLPALQTGFYAVLASPDTTFSTDQMPIGGLIINVTDLALFATAAIEDNPDKYVWTLSSQPTTQTPPLFHFYTLNLKTGLPEPNATIDVIVDRNQTQHLHVNTRSDGYAYTTIPLLLKGPQHSVWTSFSSLAEKNGNTALAAGNSFNIHTQQPVRLFLQTDRAIYRPGQKVSVSVQAFQTTPHGFTVLPNKTVQLKVRGANYKQLFSTSLTLNAFGTAQTQFSLPDEQEMMLGHCSLEASLKTNQGNFSGNESFLVEQYKRPEYEISLKEPVAPLAYKKKGTVSGQAQYYTGAPLQNAPVKYTITRRAYLPPFYWWRWRDYESSEQIAQGETQTDETGNFQISWVLQPIRENENFTQYTVKAEIADESGRPIDTTRTYKVSTYPQLFEVDFTQGFYDADVSTPLAHIALTDADGKKITGTVTARISRVEDTPVLTKGELPFYDNQRIDPLNQWYQEAKELDTVLTQKLTFDKPISQPLQLPALPEGIYRLTLQAPQAEAQKIIFIVAAQKSSLHLPAVTRFQHDTYHPGETARLLLGAGALTGTKWVEIYRKGQFLQAREQLPPAISIYEYPVTADDRGGVALRWFGTSDYRIYQGTSSFTVPFDNQELAVSIQSPQTLQPGQPVTWKITAKNNQNAPVNGQASLTVYDKALDYYASNTHTNLLNALFTQNTSAPELSISTATGYAHTIFTKRQVHSWKTPLALPTLDLIMPQAFYGRNLRKGLAFTAAPMMTKSVAVNSLETQDMALTEGVQEETALLARGTETPREATPRTDFSETAYFNSLLPIKNGKAQAHFTFPQSVTSWNIQGFALTQNAQTGTFAASTITRKDFMVQLHLPRFLREKDSTVLQASVTNLTSKRITVPVTISITQNGKKQTSAFGITNFTQSVTVPPNATRYTQWNITVPSAPALYDITAAARTAQMSDAEMRQLPILPGVSRLLASAHVALKNGANTLHISELDEGTDAQIELATLQINPSLALSVLQAMPNLLLNTRQDLISSLDRYIPLAIVNTFYTTNPALKEAVQKLPHHQGITPIWEEQNPLRLTVLEQAPWLRLAQGETPGNWMSLLDTTLVEKQLAKEQKRVLKFQNANGSFSWFAGGPADTYLTLRALDSFSQAVRFGVPIPQEAAEKALAYVVPQIERQLKEDKTGSAQTVSYALYAAYTLSAFPAHWTQVATAKTYIQKWVDYASQQSRFMTPLGLTYAAAIYHRLGDDVKANQYIDKVVARMKYNPLTGSYFAPEAQSWLWYQDTITTQTATLKTLLEVRPQALQIEPMVQWLLFNKQVTSWQNPAATAQAIFALLDVMKTRGALCAPSTYQIKWAEVQEKRTFKPFDWTENLRWIKTGQDLSNKAYNTATITKQSKMTDFASLNIIYTTAQANASPQGIINVAREYFIRVNTNNTPILRPIQQLSEANVGDEVEVHLTLTTDSAFDYVLLTDPKPATFETAERTSAWTWKPLSVYRELRDAETQFFIPHLPAGKVKLSYTLRPTLPGNFHAKPAQVQSMYAPQYGAHSATQQIQISK